MNINRRLAGAVLAVVLAAAGLAAQRGTPEPRGKIFGRVIDASTGKPIAGAEVAVSEVPPTATVIPVVQSGVFAMTPQGAEYGRVLTDTAGRFSIGGIPDGAYEISASKPGWVDSAFGENPGGGARSWTDINSTNRATDVSVVLSRLAAVTGRVIDEQGRPKSGVAISITRHDATANGWLSGYATDDRGEFYVAVPPGKWIIGAVFGPTLGHDTPRASSANGHQRFYEDAFYPGVTTRANAVPLTLAAGERRSGIDFTLSALPGFRVAVSLTGASDRKNTSIVIRRRGQSENARPWPVGGRADDVVFSGVRPGEYVITALSGPPMPMMSHGLAPLPALPVEDTLFAETSVVVSDRDQHVALSMAAGVRIQGTVRFNGSSAPPDDSALKVAAIAIDEADHDEWDLRGLYLPGRRWASVQVPPGSYFVGPGVPRSWSVEAIEAGGRDLLSLPIPVAGSRLDDVVITLTDRLPLLVVRVAKTAEQVRTRPWIVAFPTETAGWPTVSVNRPRIKQVILGAEPTAELRLPPGQYWVVALDAAPTSLTAEVLRRLAALATPATLLPRGTSSVELTVHRSR